LNSNPRENNGSWCKPHRYTPNGTAPRHGGGAITEESLFVAALDKQTAAERRAFLAEACAGDIGLRERVEQLLEAHERTVGILDESVRPPGWTELGGGSGPGGAGAVEYPGDVISGRYRLIEEIGGGGMGTVWKAEQTQPVRRTVAIKLIKAGMDSKTVLSRFEAERQALALMEHPNIARVLDGGTTKSGRPFFAMDYVKGVPFTQYCDNVRLSIADRLRLFLPVCHAVQHAHAKGVIHRDLKPSNILVCLYDGQPVPKVIDFGLAKATQQPLTEQTLHTAHGALLGTPLYMSPEQAERNNLDVDARTDVYALGVILYELLTGTTPVERQRFQEAGWHELLRLIIEKEPPRPSTRLSSSDSLPTLAALRRLDPVRLTRAVRGELDWIVMKCLEKDPSRRYETVSGLSRDVQRYLAHESVEACPPSAGYRLGKFIGRNRGVAAAVSTIIVLLMGGITGTTWGLIRADRARRAEATRAQGERRAHEQAEMRLRQIKRVSEVLASIFTDLDPRTEGTEGRPLRAILGDRLDQAAADLEVEALGDPLAAADLQARLGRAYLVLGHPSKATSQFTRALATRRELPKAENSDALAIMSLLAVARRELGDVNEAIALGERVRDAQQRILGPDAQATLTTKNNLAMALSVAGRSSEAAALLGQVRDAFVRRFGPDDPQTLEALDNLSAAYVSSGQGPEAIALAEQVRDAQIEKLGGDHPLAIGSMNNVALRCSAIGNMSKAVALLEQARDAIVPRLGRDDPRALLTLDNLARMYRAAGRAKEAIPLAEQVRNARVRTLGARHRETIHSLENLGLAYQAAGQPEKGAPLFQQAAQGLEQLAFIHDEAALIVETWCDWLVSHGDTGQADLWRQKWLAAVKQNAGPESPAYVRVLEEQGANMLRVERHADAERLLRECLAIRQSKQPLAWSTYRAESMLGEALAGLRKHAQAEPVLLRAYEGLKTREREIPPLRARHHVELARARIVKLYDTWGRPEQAALWRLGADQPRDEGPGAGGGRSCSPAHKSQSALP
jgi:tetratricopeptide (TPR) repeat protein